MTVEFGSTAWGRAWLSRIQPVLTAALDRDLPRARNLARRTGGLTIHGNQVTGTVADRGRRHVITLTIPTWSNDEHRAAARLLNGSERAGDIPDELVDELASAGVTIAPEIGTISVTADVDSPKRPLILALCYALVQRVDEEPTLAVRLRTPPDAKAMENELPTRIALTEIDPATFYDV